MAFDADRSTFIVSGFFRPLILPLIGVVVDDAVVLPLLVLVVGCSAWFGIRPGWPQIVAQFKCDCDLFQLKINPYAAPLFGDLGQVHWPSVVAESPSQWL